MQRANPEALSTVESKEHPQIAAPLLFKIVFFSLQKMSDDTAANGTTVKSTAMPATQYTALN
jgi:hypothetical protein